MLFANERIEELRQIVNHHNKKYYIDAAPEISDREFDKLLQELIDLEAEHPDLVTPDSPTQRVGGAPIGEFKTVKHRLPMLSIDNTYNSNELREFDKRIRKLLPGEKIKYVVELKIDGVAMSLTYEDGTFTQGVTRGDGVQGDDVTHNLKTLREVPLRLKIKKIPKLLEARGEVYMTRAELARINKEQEAKGKPTYANPRNLSAGTLKQKDPKQCAKRKLQLFCYSVGAYEGVAIKSHLDALKLLGESGFPVNPNTKSFDAIDEVVDYCESWSSRRAELPYEIDGMVVKVNDFDQQNRLGSTSKAPRWVVAYKFAAEQKLTRLLKITVEVGKQGTLTPLAHLDPVHLAGTTVSRASLHNEDFISGKDIRVGDMVVVEKAGEIIPYIVRTETEARTGKEKKFHFPKSCPACGGPIERVGAFHRCQNGAKCTGILKQMLESFASRKVMDIEGLGEKVVHQLVEAKLVKSLPDIYRLDLPTLTALERMGEKSAKNLLKGIEDSKTRGLARVLAGLGIPNVGSTSGGLLADEFGSIEMLRKASLEQLEAIEGIGPIMANHIYDYFQSEIGQSTIDDLLALGVKMSADAKPSPAALGGVDLSGKSFVVTGTLVNYKRDEIEDLIKAHGGKASSSVSKKTSYLVAGENAGSKLDKAQKLGVPVLSEDEFRKLMAK